MGSPHVWSSTYDAKAQAAAVRIIEAMDNGASLRQACKDLKIPRATLYRWMDSTPTLEAALARARLRQADLMDDEIRDLAQQVKESNANSARVKLHALIWRASRLSPRKYGERVEVDQHTTIAVVRARPLTAQEWAEKHGGQVIEGEATGVLGPPALPSTGLLGPKESI